MDTTFECKSDQSCAIFSCVSLSKHESFCMYERGCKIKLSNAYLKLLIIEFDDPEKLLPAEEDIHRIHDDLEYEHDALKNTPTNKNAELKEPSCSSENRLYIGYAADIIVRVRKEAS